MNASAIRELVQSASVNSTARALSASPRSRDSARLRNATLCSSLAANKDLPAMFSPSRIIALRDAANHSQHLLASQMNSA